VSSDVSTVGLVSSPVVIGEFILMYCKEWIEVMFFVLLIG
jgi:hypothetical protein